MRRIIAGIVAAMLGAGAVSACAREVWMQRVSWSGAVGEGGGFEASVVRNEHGQAEGVSISVPDSSWSIEWGATHELRRTTLVEATVRRRSVDIVMPVVHRETKNLGARAGHIELQVRVLVDDEPERTAVVRFDAPR